MKAKHAEAEKALADAHQNLTNLRTQLDDWKAQVRSDRAVAERAKNILNGEKQVEEALDRAKQHERNVGECEAALAKAEEVVAGLERQEAAVREENALRAGISEGRCSSQSASLLHDLALNVKRASDDDVLDYKRC